MVGTVGQAALASAVAYGLAATLGGLWVALGVGIVAGAVGGLGGRALFRNPTVDPPPVGLMWPTLLWGRAFLGTLPVLPAITRISDNVPHHGALRVGMLATAAVAGTCAALAAGHGVRLLRGDVPNMRRLGLLQVIAAVGGISLWGLVAWLTGAAPAIALVPLPMVALGLVVGWFRPLGPRRFPSWSDAVGEVAWLQILTIPLLASACGLVVGLAMSLGSVQAIEGIMTGGGAPMDVAAEGTRFLGYTLAMGGLFVLPSPQLLLIPLVRLVADRTSVPSQPGSGPFTV
ncbi:MAG: hypothetical protein KTR31_31190 [Myxococcales bacterium]|nr:hypothetical protein [Myxococcales bacterium]